MMNHRASTLRKAQVEVKRLWHLCCEFEGVPYDSQFVVFNTNNPFRSDYNKAMEKFMRLKRDMVSAADLRADHEIIVRALCAKSRQAAQ